MARKSRQRPLEEIGELLRNNPEVVERLRKRLAATAEVRKSGIDHFREKLEENETLANVITDRISPSFLLLQEFYKPGPKSEKLLKKLGFQEENLERLLSAIFSALGRRKYSVSEVQAILQREGKSTISALYYNVLGLKDDSTEQEIDAKLERFTSALAPLKDFMEFRHFQEVAAAIDDFLERKPVSLRKIGIVFDEGENGGIERILAKEVSDPSPDSKEARTSAADPVISEAAEATEEINYAAFLKVLTIPERQQILSNLEYIHKNFSLPEDNLDEEKFEALLTALNNCNPNPNVFLGINLYNKASEEGSQPVDLLKVIAETCDITDEIKLRGKLVEISEVMGIKKEAFVPDQPANPEPPIEAAKTEEAGKSPTSSHPANPEARNLAPEEVIKPPEEPVEDTRSLLKRLFGGKYA